MLCVSNFHGFENHSRKCPLSIFCAHTKMSDDNNDYNRNHKFACENPRLSKQDYCLESSYTCASSSSFRLHYNRHANRKWVIFDVPFNSENNLRTVGWQVASTAQYRCRHRPGHTQKEHIHSCPN